MSGCCVALIEGIGKEVQSGLSDSKQTAKRDYREGQREAGWKGSGMLHRQRKESTGKSRILNDQTGNYEFRNVRNRQEYILCVTL